MRTYAKKMASHLGDSLMVHTTNDQHEHEFYFSSYCGVNICIICESHKELARCYCGWSALGGDGYQELMEMGEQIEEDY